MKKFQILTHGNKHLAMAIQEKLKELGYDMRLYLPCDCNHYYVARWSNRICPEEAFEQSGDPDTYGPFITLDELFQMKAEPKETIKIGDSTYDKAEFEEATKNLNPIQ